MKIIKFILGIIVDYSNYRYHGDKVHFFVYSLKKIFLVFPDV